MCDISFSMLISVTGTELYDFRFSAFVGYAHLNEFWF